MSASDTEPRLVTVAGRDTWHVYHNRKRVSTGALVCEGAAGRAQAQRFLADYKAGLANAVKDSGITIAAILPLYLATRQAKGKPGAERLSWAHKPLARHLGDKLPDTINDDDIARYLAARTREGVKSSTARTELEALRAALRWGCTARAGRIVTVAPEIEMPDRPEARDRWLTEAEAERLADACQARHIRLFVRIALCTAARRGAILALTWDRVDLDRGLIDYRVPGERATRKRKVPVPINATLLAELQAAKTVAATPHVIEYAGGQVEAIKTGFRAACARAGLVGVTPHTLRHTAVTWMCQRGVPIWQVSGFAGMTQEMVQEVYGHHHPDYLRQAADALN